MSNRVAYKMSLNTHMRSLLEQILQKLTYLLAAQSRVVYYTSCAHAQRLHA